MTLPFIFLSGAYGDHDGYLVIDERIHRAREHALALARAGIPYFSPHLNSCHFEAIGPDVPLEFWHRQDDVFRDAAAAVLVITEGWASSSGTRRDVQQANAHKQPVYFTADIPRLLGDWEQLAAYALANHGNLTAFDLSPGPLLTAQPTESPPVSDPIVAIEYVGDPALQCPACGRLGGNHNYSCRLSPMYVEHAGGAE